ncbi:MAG: prolyl-tRNA synthetase associated domain-containing protein [Pseudomonadota bacterium]
MLASPEDLFAYLDRLGIAHETHWHEPVFRVEDGRDLKAALPGGHTKNLFLADKDGALVLISAWADSRIPLNRLHKPLGTRRLSFAPAEMMTSVLGVTPGSVTAFALANDTENKVRFVLDAALKRFEMVNFHPLQNHATTRITLADLQRFLTATGHDMTEIDFAGI